MDVFIVFLIVLAYTKGSSWANRTITIAVVEYQPINDETLANDEIVLANTKNYITMLQSISDQKPNMIIFPEATLNVTQQSAVAIHIDDNPCDSENYAQFIRNLSCAARAHKSYIVINILEKTPCDISDTNDNCRNFGYYFYNTDVVFDSDGTIVNRYRKFYLYYEKGTDRPSSPEVVTIPTNFGVTFGIFTCFDILFKDPTDDLLGKNVDAVIYPTMWHSDLPFETALQIQQMWAHTHNITLFAAGANDPKLGNGGTGIYRGSDGAVISDIIAEGGSRVYIYKYIAGKPPIKPVQNQDPDVLGKAMDNFYLTSDETLPNYNSVVLDTSKQDLNTQVCFNSSNENQICCNFTTKIFVDRSNSDKNSYTYHLVAYSGIRHNGYNDGIEICGIIACLNSELSSCGRRFPKYEDITWPLTFEEITIKANFEKTDNKTQYPNSLLSSIRPINAKETIWTKEEVEIDGKDFILRTFSLMKPQNRLLTFAIYGRNFAQDSPLDHD